MHQLRCFPRCLDSREKFLQGKFQEGFRKTDKGKFCGKEAPNVKLVKFCLKTLSFMTLHPLRSVHNSGTLREEID